MHGLWPLSAPGRQSKAFVNRCKRNNTAGLGIAVHAPCPVRGSRRWIDATLLALLSAAVFCVGARASLVPRQPEQGVAVVFAPWTAPEAALTKSVAAGARFVRFGGVGFVAITIPDDGEYPSRAFSLGAWFVVDPQLIVACVAPFGIEAQS